MYVAQRKPQEALLLRTSDGPIVVKLLRSGRGSARIGVEAPESVEIVLLDEAETEEPVIALPE